jgi:hypothetical protein
MEDSENPINTRFFTNKLAISPGIGPGVCLAYGHWKSSLFVSAFQYGTVVERHFERILSEPVTLEPVFPALSVFRNPYKEPGDFLLFAGLELAYVQGKYFELEIQ